MDVAARNCLLHTNNVVKLADFGLTVKYDSGKKHHTLTVTKKLSMKWLAPEVVSTKRLSGLSNLSSLTS
jgi:serine/threonine protein kinase